MFTLSDTLFYTDMRMELFIQRDYEIFYSKFTSQELEVSRDTTVYRRVSLGLEADTGGGKTERRASK